MGLRRWLREQVAGDHGEEGEDSPPNASLLNNILGREEDRVRSLGEYDASTYPPEMTEQLRRRQEVAERLLALDITTADARVAAIPELKELLRVYPHPLAYETLILAYVDDGRFDEAKGVAFAAQARRAECGESPFPEICAETAHLRDWTPEEVERLREERTAGKPDD